MAESSGSQQIVEVVILYTGTTFTGKLSNLTSNGGSPSTDKKTVDYEHIATIAAACTSAMLLVILLCVCCCPCGGSRKVRKYDERPLLSWSRSYSSTGTYHLMFLFAHKY